MKDDIIRWMKEFVEVPHPNFGNFAPCPYAKEARIENKIKFVEFPNSRPDSDIEPYVRNMMLDEFDVTILIFEKDRWTAKETFEIARKMEKIAIGRGLLLSEDHPEMIEVVGDTILNQGDYIIFFIQGFDKQNRYAQKLRKTKYYDNFKNPILNDRLNAYFTEQEEQWKK